ncbi:sorting nexin-5-like isoform X2 [Babylonia areolata]|uniref:sorting nexin-5-like isoform X2 n=1 Tax=Babylonia areolata TaxID=304850 RepID=UPI003FD29E05
MMSNEEECPDIPYEDPEEPEEDSVTAAADGALNTGTLPIFRVLVTEAVKDGTTLQFTIMATRVEGDRGMVVTRQFQDIEWLHHCLVTDNETDGIIVPPLPARPEIDPKSVESKTKKQLGSDCHVLRPDNFDLECKAIQKYLTLMLTHPSFGRDKTLAAFLSEKEAAAPTKVSKGLMGWLSTTIDSARKSQHKDIDEYFSKEREWAAEYGKASKEAAANFNKVIQSQWRMTSALQNFTSTLASVLTGKDESTQTVNKLLLRLSEAMDSSRKGLETVSQADEKLLGSELDFLARYLDSVREMLFRRTCLMINFEDAARALDKAKPQKKEAAEELKTTTEAAYDKCSENARRELKNFMRHRTLTLQEGLVGFTESQIRTSREIYTQVLSILKEVQADE